MIYLIACIASYLSGIGIGGGSSFIILTFLFNLLDTNSARTYNLLLFISVGIVIFFKNFKKQKLINKDYIKTFVFILIGCILGIILNKFVAEENLKKYFYIFMLIIGIYEIISSLLAIKKDKNNYKKGDS